MLLTTPYCTDIASTGTSLEFTFCKEILQVNKQIFVEATRVLLEENDFVTLKVTGMDLDLKDVPTFRNLAEEHGDCIRLSSGYPKGFRGTELKIMKPVLRVEVVDVVTPYSSEEPFTLITTPEGIQPIITALWRLKENVLKIIMVRPSHLSLSLHFNDIAPARRGILRKILMEPWERFHGINKLALTGNIGDNMWRHLEISMLEEPIPTAVISRLRKYYSLAKKEMMQQNYSAAQWYCTLFEGYYQHLGLLKVDFSGPRNMKDPNDQHWNDVWTESKTMFFQEQLGLMKTYLRQLRYGDIVSSAIKRHNEVVHPWIVTNYSVNPVLTAKFQLCEILAHTALGEIYKGLEKLPLVARGLAGSSLYNAAGGQDRCLVTEDLLKILLKAINMELSNLNSRYRREPLELAKESTSRDWQVERNRTFWEWLDIPEV
jgi:hypothetical protein